MKKLKVTHDELTNLIRESWIEVRSNIKQPLVLPAFSS